MKLTQHSFVFGLVVALVTLVADQASKLWVVHALLSPEQPSISVLPFFQIVMVWNRGISFGMFAGLNQPLVLVGLSLLVVGILLVWLHKNTSPLLASALGMVIGGAVGNMGDRLHYGAVVDFLDFSLGEYHWPAFNIADSAIFIGVVLLTIHSMFIDTKSNAKEHA